MPPTRTRRTRASCKQTLYSRRKHVYHQSDPTLRAGSLTKSQLTKNARGKIVAKKKSKVAKRQYNEQGNGLRQWNEAARKALQDMDDTEDRELYDPYDPFDDTLPYVPFQAAAGRRRSATSIA